MFGYFTTLCMKGLMEYEDNIALHMLHKLTNGSRYSRMDQVKFVEESL